MIKELENINAHNYIYLHLLYLIVLYCTVVEAGIRINGAEESVLAVPFAHLGFGEFIHKLEGEYFTSLSLLIIHLMT
jgi:hypothetical protein